MRRSAWLIIVAFVSLLVACSKKSPHNDLRLAGKWKQTEYLISPGPMGTWEPYNGNEFYLEFHANGTFTATRQFLWGDYTRYKLIDDAKMMVYTESFDDSVRLDYSIVSGKLTMWLQCIEPCGIRLVRVGDK
jgi:hypothetical protein